MPYYNQSAACDLAYSDNLGETLISNLLAYKDAGLNEFKASFGQNLVDQRIAFFASQNFSTEVIEELYYEWISESTNDCSASIIQSGFTVCQGYYNLRFVVDLFKVN